MELLLLYFSENKYFVFGIYIDIIFFLFCIILRNKDLVI